MTNEFVYSLPDDLGSSYADVVFALTQNQQGWVNKMAVYQDDEASEAAFSPKPKNYNTASLVSVKI